MLSQFSQDAEGNTWSEPFRHFDRSKNVLGLSREDFERMCKFAADHPGLKQALEEAKMYYLLLDDPRRKPDSHCFPKIVRTADGKLVK